MTGTPALEFDGDEAPVSRRCASSARPTTICASGTGPTRTAVPKRAGGSSPARSRSCARAGPATPGVNTIPRGRLRARRRDRPHRAWHDGRGNLTAVEPADPLSDRDVKHADERERLYRAGWVVLRRNGYANAGITEILGEAGLGTRAFYRHFDSKDELLVSMFADNASATARRLADHVDLAGSPLARVRSWIDEILALGDDPRHGEAARMFISPTMPGVFDEAGNEAIAELRAPLRSALADGAAAGDFPDCDPGCRRGDDSRHRVATVHRRHQRPGRPWPRRGPRPRRTFRPPRPRCLTPLTRARPDPTAWRAG